VDRAISLIPLSRHCSTESQRQLAASRKPKLATDMKVHASGDIARVVHAQIAIKASGIMAEAHSNAARRLNNALISSRTIL
jgi:hypothetical protein